jgi:hypothetical protein
MDQRFKHKAEVADNIRELTFKIKNLEGIGHEIVGFTWDGKRYVLIAKRPMPKEEVRLEKEIKKKKIFG